MEAHDLEVVQRLELGKGASGRMRKVGLIPAVLCSPGESSVGITVSEKNFRQNLSGRHTTHMFKFKSNNKDLDGVVAILKELQVEPIKRGILHADFIKVVEDRPVVVVAPLEIVGGIEAVKQGVAIVQQTVYSLSVECLPSLIPSHVTVDISDVKVGHALKAGQIVLPDGVKLKSSSNTTVLSVFAKNKAAAEEVEAKAKK